MGTGQAWHGSIARRAPDRVLLLEADPDLGAGLGDDERAGAAQHSAVVTFSVGSGAWRPTEDGADLGCYSLYYPVRAAEYLLNAPI